MDKRNINEIFSIIDDIRAKQKFLSENINHLDYQKIDEGIWDNIKHGLSKLGSWEKGGKAGVFSRGKQQAAATAEMDTLLDQQSNKLVSDMVKNIKTKYPEWPNMKSKDEFAEAVNVIAVVYDSVVDASKKNPNDKGYLDSKIANSIINTIHKYVDKIASYDLAAIYRRFAEDKENDLSLVSILNEAGVLKGAGEDLAAYNSAKSNKAVIAWLAGALGSYGLGHLATGIANSLQAPIPSTGTGSGTGAEKSAGTGAEKSAGMGDTTNQTFSKKAAEIQPWQQSQNSFTGEDPLIDPNNPTQTVTGAEPNANVDVNTSLRPNPNDPIPQMELPGTENNPNNTASNTAGTDTSTLGDGAPPQETPSQGNTPPQETPPEIQNGSPGSKTNPFQHNTTSDGKFDLNGIKDPNTFTKTGSHTFHTEHGQVTYNAKSNMIAGTNHVNISDIKVNGEIPGRDLKNALFKQINKPSNNPFWGLDETIINEETIPQPQAKKAEFPPEIKKQIDALNVNNMTPEQAKAAITKILKRFLMTSGGIAILSTYTGISVPALMGSLIGKVVGVGASAATSVGVSSASLATAGSILTGLAIPLAAAGVATYFIKRNARTNSRLAVLQGLSKTLALVPDSDEAGAEAGKNGSQAGAADSQTQAAGSQAGAAGSSQPNDKNAQQETNLFNSIKNLLLILKNKKPVIVKEELDEVINSPKFIKDAKVLDYLNKNVGLEKMKVYMEFIQRLDNIKRILINFKTTDQVLLQLINKVKANKVSTMNFDEIFMNINSSNPKVLNNYMAMVKDFFAKIFNSPVGTKFKDLSSQLDKYNIKEKIELNQPKTSDVKQKDSIKSTTQSQSASEKDAGIMGQRTEILKFIPLYIQALLNLFSYMLSKSSKNKKTSPAAPGNIFQNAGKNVANIVNNAAQSAKATTNTPSQPIKEEAMNLITQIIKEELKHYDKVQFKHIGKSAPKKLDKEKKSEEIKVDDKKAKFLEDITNFVKEYNNTNMSEEDFCEKLVSLGKQVKAKKNTIESNIENYKRRPSISAYEVALMFQECPCEKDKSSTYEVPSADKKNDPEKAKKVKEVK